MATKKKAASTSGAKSTAKSKKTKAAPQHARPTVRVTRPMGMQARGR